MIAEAIEKIKEMARQQVISVGGRDFVIDGATYEEIYPVPLYPSPLELNSLDALVKMITNEGMGGEYERLFIKIPSALRVDCYTYPFDEKRRCERPTLYVAQATDVPGWEEKVQLGFEEAMIALRTRFQDTPDTVYALKLLSDITTGAKVTFADNGIATSIVTKKGIDLQANMAIKPIISLKPYRTFQEVEQPASEFLIRINERGISFIEADGGMWKLAARQTVKKYLEDRLAEYVQDGKVVVML